MQSEEKLKQLLAITNIPIEHVKKHGYIKCVESIHLGETYTFSKEGYLMMVNLGKQDTEVPIILFEDGEDELPSVTPQSRKGHWIPVFQGDEIIDYRCSCCEFGNTFGKGTVGMNYCPRCGSRNEVEV